MLEIGNPKNPKILIVDDETEVLNSLSDLLRKDFHIFATADTGEALRLMTENTMFSLVISDQRMPIMTGAELLANVASISPDTARILLTGYADIDAVIEAVNQGQIVRYITKPWDGNKLLELLKPIAEKHHLLLENRRLIRELAQLNEAAEDSTTRVEALENARFTLQNENEVLKFAHEQLENSFWHLKKIQEVLPICMECGKVKSSESSWEDVVSYLKNNSMFLSHGYCPDCYEKIEKQWHKTTL